MTAVEVLAAHRWDAGDCTCGWSYEYYERPYAGMQRFAAHQLSALADAGFRVVPAEAPRSDLGGLAAREAGR